MHLKSFIFKVTIMIFFQLTQQLQALSNLLSLLNNKQYSHKIEHLGNASIGGHTRHIIELLQCAVKGHARSEVDYVNRTRNLMLELDKNLAGATIDNLKQAVHLPDIKMKLITEELGGTAKVSVTTTYNREIVYNTEHVIHHLALIKVALIEMNLNIVDNNFGMAYSTIKYKAALTQTL
jgi:hypothetical protein